MAPEPDAANKPLTAAQKKNQARSAARKAKRAAEKAAGVAGGNNDGQDDAVAGADAAAKALGELEISGATGGAGEGGTASSGPVDTAKKVWRACSLPALFGTAAVRHSLLSTSSAVFPRHHIITTTNKRILGVVVNYPRVFVCRR